MLKFKGGEEMFWTEMSYYQYNMNLTLSQRLEVLDEIDYDGMVENNEFDESSLFVFDCD